MELAQATGDTEQLQQLCDRITHWRKHRPSRSVPMPHELWDAAVQLAQERGIHATAKAVGLNYGNLKARVLQHQGQSTQDNHALTPAFVEVRVPPADCGSHNDLVVEWIDQRGERMRIQASNPAAVDLVGLAHAFWSRRP